MKTSTRINKVLEMGDAPTSVTGFSVTQNAHMFEILSEKVYNNQIGAIVRELCCNAYDAHIEAGVGDKPVEVHLPTYTNPNFVVRDYGFGLSPEDMKTIYTTYGLSTKNTSNDYIGQLGIGAKSPFGYTDSFYIESHYQGQKYVYIARKGINGTPELVSIEKPFPTEDTGLKVSVPVKTTDISRFTQEAINQLYFFNPRPTFNVHVPFAEHNPIISTNEFEIGDFSGVLMGNVRYNIDYKFAVEQGCPELDKKHLHTMSVLLKVGIGDVDVAPSRESVSWTPKTIRTITNRINKLNSEITKELQINIDKCHNIVEAHRYLAGYNIDSKEFNYRGTKIPNFSLPGWQYVKASYRDRYVQYPPRLHDITQVGRAIILVPESILKPEVRIRRYMIEKGIARVTIIRECEAINEVRKIVKDDALLNIVLYNDIKTKLPKREKTPQVKLYELKYNDWHGVKDSVEKGVYVKLYGHTIKSNIVREKRDIHNLTELLKAIEGKPVKIYGVRPAFYKEIEANKNFIPLDDYLKKQLSDPNNAKKYVAVVNSNKNREIYSRVWDSPDLSKDSLFYKLYSQVADLAIHNNSIESIYLAKNILKHFDVEANIDIDDTLKKIDETYPLLNLAPLYGGYEKEFIIYINAKET